MGTVITSRLHEQWWIDSSRGGLTALLNLVKQRSFRFSTRLNRALPEARQTLQDREPGVDARLSVLYCTLTTPCRHSPASWADRLYSRKPGQTPAYSALRRSPGTPGANADRFALAGGVAAGGCCRTNSARVRERIVAPEYSRPAFVPGQCSSASHRPETRCK